MTTSPGLWFGECSEQAINDFFDLCEAHGDVNEASARELERQRGITSVSVAAQVRDARDRLRAARAGDWEPFERHLTGLGARYAREGMELGAWPTVVHRFYREVMPRFVAELSDPERLTNALLVLGDYMERSMILIATAYRATAVAIDDLERQHVDVLAASLESVIAIDDDGCIVDFNAAASRTFGYAREQALGQRLDDLIVPLRSRQAHRVGLHRVVTTGETRLIGRRVELVAMRKDGSEIPVELSLIATRTQLGERRFTAFIRDLTEQKQAEASNALWAHAFDQAQFGVVTSDVDTSTIRSVNKAYARMLGYSAEELQGADGKRLVSSRNDDVIRELRDRGSSTYELWLLRKDGSRFPALASTSTVEIRAGVWLRISTVLDMSERHELEQARAANRTTIETNAARIELLSRAGHEFALASGLHALLALVARRVGEISGGSCSVELENDNDATTSSSEQLRAVYSGELDRGEPVHTITVPLLCRDRKIGTMVLARGARFTSDELRLIADVANRAALALDNAKLLSTLERRVAERTADLEAANRELETFSFTVSHDLRAPLRAINGFSRAIAEDYADKLDDQAKHHFQRILAATGRMASLIDDLLALARIGRTLLRRTDVDLSAMVGEVGRELSERNPGRDVELVITPGLHTQADPRLVRVVLENLLSNAWKFTAKRGQAKIRFEGDDESFSISDNGAGFDMADAAKLFVAFQRLHTSDDFDGTGVGLATVDRIVRLHGGQIWAESSVGLGATFFFTFGYRRADSSSSEHRGS